MQELSRVPQTILKAKELTESGNRKQAIRMLEDLVSETDTIRASALLAELLLQEGNKKASAAVLAPKTYVSNETRLLTVAALINSAAGVIVDGQLEFCSSLILERLGVYPEAAAALQAPKKGPQLATLLSNLAMGIEWDFTGRPRTAAFYYDKAWSVDRGNPVTALRYATALLAQKKRVESRQIATAGMYRAKGRLKEALSRLTL